MLDAIPVASWGQLFLGLLMLIGGIALIFWSNRNSARAELARINREAAQKAFTHDGPGADKRQKRVATSKQDATSFVGVLGFIIAISGLMLTIFGVFGTVD